jgi:transcription antitermination factor NusG
VGKAHGVGVSALRWIRGAYNLVTFNNQLASVPETLIHAISQRVGRINSKGGEIFDGLEPGQEVMVEDGPFAGYSALIQACLPSSERGCFAR